MKRRNIKHRAATIDEKFFVVVGGESVLDFSALTAVGFEAGQGTDGERGEREEEKSGKQKAEGCDENFLFEGLRFEGRARAREVLRIAYCVFRVEDGEGEGAGKLNDGEEGGEGQIELLDGLDVDFHFEGGKLRSAEEEDDAEGGEVEEEDENRRGEDG